MFQRLKSMFVGEINNSSSKEPELSEKEVDDWIVIDFIDTNFSAKVEEEDVSVEEEDDHPPVFSYLPDCLADTSESCFVHMTYPMEESWFIAPPPCFTAGGLSTVKVETSPLENLLIEHPSMSVYNFYKNLNEGSCETDELHNPSSPRMERQNEVGQHVHCYVAALTAHSPFLEQTKSFRPAQWIKEHGERHSLNRNNLRRQNLTRDCHSRQIKHNGWVVHQPSQRQYNY